VRVLFRDPAFWQELGLEVPSGQDLAVPTYEELSYICRQAAPQETFMDAVAASGYFDLSTANPRVPLSVSDSNQPIETFLNQAKQAAIADARGQILFGDLQIVWEVDPAAFEHAVQAWQNAGAVGPAPYEDRIITITSSSFLSSNTDFGYDADQLRAVLGKGKPSMLERAKAFGTEILKTGTSTFETIGNLPMYAAVGGIVVIALVAYLAWLAMRAPAGTSGYLLTQETMAHMPDPNAVLKLAKYVPDREPFGIEARKMIHDRNCLCDSCATDTSFRRDAAGPTARDFYVTPSSRSSLTQLPVGEYGRTYLDTRPFQVEIASDAVPERQRIALTHELLHVYDQVHKLGISHEALHGLAYYINSEVLPGIAALDQIVG